MKKEIAAKLRNQNEVAGIPVRFFLLLAVRLVDLLLVGVEDLFALELLCRSHETLFLVLACVRV
jgi:hypothetical protein